MAWSKDDFLAKKRAEKAQAETSAIRYVSHDGHDQVGDQSSGEERSGLEPEESEDERSGAQDLSGQPEDVSDVGFEDPEVKLIPGRIIGAVGKTGCTVYQRENLIRWHCVCGANQTALSKQSAVVNAKTHWHHCLENMDDPSVKPRVAPGSRVRALLEPGANPVGLIELGSGEFLGMQVPPEGLSPLLDVLAATGTPSPAIKLDDGQMVYGCECAWGEEKTVTKLIDSLNIGVELTTIEAQRSMFNVWEK